ncbi:MAG: outer membrane beta-barrel protein [candidate division Zixibacteria bacterium]|nr:outer membrane beta-barrel protein [candidate division Zixibacteria bacterium]
MRKGLVLLMVLLVSTWWVSAFAEESYMTIAELKDKVVRLEKQLSNLNAAYNRDIPRLREASTSNTSSNNTELTQLRQDMDALTTEMMHLRQSLTRETTQTGSDTERLASIEHKLEMLQMRLDAWRHQSEEYADLTAPNVRPQQIDKSSMSIEEFEITGFVDGSYAVDVPTGENTFGFDQAEVNIIKTIGEVGEVRADVEWVSDGQGDFELSAEQGYVVFSPTFLSPVNFTFGKYNAPIGFELLDAPDMYQYSHALVFNYGLPTNVSGAMISAEFAEHFDARLYVCNGWDQNVDVNTGKTVGTRFGYSNENALNITTGLSFLHGAETAIEGDFTTVVDWDLSLNPTQWWTLGAEVNYGRSEISDTNLNWFGFLLMNHWDYNSWGGITVRYDYFNDSDAYRITTGVAQTRQAVAFAPTFALGKGMGALFEIRADISDKEVFTNSDGEPSKSTINFAYEMTYTF